MSRYLPEALNFLARCAVFTALHSLLALPRLKRSLAPPGQDEPCWYRFAYNLISLVAFAWVMAAWRSSPVLYYAPGIWSLLMYAAQLSLVVALCFCLHQTGTAVFLGITQLRHTCSARPTLQTRGWYALVRHPLYLLSLSFMLLTPVMTAQWLALTMYAALYFIVGAIVEERRLESYFGDEYRQYRQRVPFMLPRLPRRNGR